VAFVDCTFQVYDSETARPGPFEERQVRCAMNVAR
jgi:hypothetical protein